MPVSGQSQREQDVPPRELYPFPLRPLGVGFWRKLTFLASLLLAFTYFMPAVEGCDGPRVNPSTEYRKFVRRQTKHFSSLINWNDALAKWSGQTLVYAAPYAFAFLVAIAAGLRA